MKTIRLAMTRAALFAVASSAFAQTAPSFDCTKAATSVEKLICGDSELASLDDKLAGLYGAALKKEPANQRAPQREWLQQRNACASSSQIRQCIFESYQRRIAAVQIESVMLPAPKPVGFACKGPDGVKPMSVAYYNDLDPAAALLTFDGNRVVMLVEPSGSGARYGAPGVEFWEHQGEAKFTWHGAQYTCKPVR